MKKNHHLLLLFCIIFIALICSFIPGFNQQIVENTKIDTIGHFIGFFLLTWLLTTFVKLPVTVAGLTLIFYAAATELGQAYLGFRNGEFTDFVADIVGVAAFILILWCKVIFKTRS
ncbi:MAG: VanZ family protein [Thalassotalea sp.]